MPNRVHAASPVTVVSLSTLFVAVLAGCQQGTELVRVPDVVERGGAGHADDSMTPTRRKEAVIKHAEPAAEPDVDSDFAPDAAASAVRLGARNEMYDLRQAADGAPQWSTIFELAAASWESPCSEIEPEMIAPATARPASAAFIATATPAASPMPASVAAAQPLDVITFNMEHRDRPKELAVMAEHMRTDLPRLPAFVLLQEVRFKRGGGDGEAGDGWRSTAQTLGGLLGYHAQATKRTSDAEGVGILSKYPFAYYAERHMEAQTSAFLLGFRRVSVMGEFDVPGVGRVRVVNVHLTNWETEHHVRKGQIKETLEWMARRESEVHADVTILGGDFNAKKDFSEMKLLQDRSLTGGLEFHDFNGDGPTRGGEGHPTKRIDFIFIASADRQIVMTGENRLWLEGLKNADGRTFWLSDHVPVRHGYVVGGGGIPAMVATANAN